MFWKIYWFFIIIVSVPLALGGASGYSYRAVVDHSFLIFQLIGLFGLAWRVKVFSNLTWRIFFPICFIWNFGHAFLNFYGAETIVITALYIPSLLGTFLYAYNRSEIWND
jgi:hypothetical protein